MLEAPQLFSSRQCFMNAVRVFCSPDAYAHLVRPQALQEEIVRDGLNEILSLRK